MMNRLHTLKREEGFTLIELMIVMVVLGILAGIVLFAVGAFDSAAEESVTTANNKICATAKAAAEATKTTTDTYANYLETGSTLTCP
jgi:prepilin-type N-terminal cleavage/methylation domain-containing protein